jgi:hypothetical protein
MTARHQVSAFIVCLSAVACVLGVALGAACTTTQAQQVAAPGVNLAICVAGVFVKDIQAGDSAAQIAADALATCGGDVTTIATILDSDTKLYTLAVTAKTAPAGK